MECPGGGPSHKRARAGEGLLPGHGPVVHAAGPVVGRGTELLDGIEAEDPAPVGANSFGSPLGIAAFRATHTQVVAVPCSPVISAPVISAPVTSGFDPLIPHGGASPDLHGGTYASSARALMLDMGVPRDARFGAPCLIAGSCSKSSRPMIDAVWSI